MLVTVALVLLLPMQLLCESQTQTPVFTKDYCVVGAGPSGLQMGYFFEQSNRDYVIFERSDTAGYFYTKYPRHRKLISINKRHTGKTNKEFNFRHDWNSLISHDESLQMKHYSKEFFPHADVMVQYLKDYAEKFQLNIQYNTNIVNIKRAPDSSRDATKFIVLDQRNQTYECRNMVISTGIFTPNEPEFKGMEHSVGYEDMSIDTDDYEGKTVLILGRGNSAFETADHIIASTNLIHMVARSRIKLSWETHYVGDLRAVNNGLLDTYQLKSLDGVMEAPVEEIKLVKKDGKIYVDIWDEYSTTNDSSDSHDKSEPIDNFSAREPYDAVLRCLGFKFDFSIFDDEIRPSANRGKNPGKYPHLKDDYEATGVPGLFFAGTNSHSVDYKLSAGGFIHGFRYTARALWRLLEVRNHGVAWPSVSGPTTNLLDQIIKRVNEASGIYQMFGVLGDVIVLKDGGTRYEYFEEFPVKLIPNFKEKAGKDADEIIVVLLEYGKNFSGPGKDIFRGDRATGEPMDAHNSNFLHPVLYYYSHLPTKAEMRKTTPMFNILPRPVLIHHIVEDFLTLWTAPNSHLLPLRRYLETVTGQDLRNFYQEECFALAMTSQQLPLSCQLYGDSMALSGGRMAKMNNEMAGMMSVGL